MNSIIFDGISLMGFLCFIFGFIDLLIKIKNDQKTKTKILSIFSSSKEGLENKWWHRLIKVLFVFSLIAVFAFSFVCSLQYIDISKNKINIVNNLREFTKNDNQQLDNTIPSFLEQNGELGCLNGDTINYISSYDLENNCYCNKDMINNIDKAIAVIAKVQNSYFSISEVEKFKNDRIAERDAFLQKGEEIRYCNINKSIECTSNNIIKYNKNIFYYGEAFIYSILVTALFYLIFIILYYKVFIYIIYGNKNKI